MPITPLSSFTSEEQQLKETLQLFSPEHPNQGRYLAVKDGALSKINFLQLIWEKIKGVFRGKDATSTYVIKLKALETIAIGAKCIQSKEEYQLIETLARQAGLIPATLKKPPENIQELTKEIGKKLFTAKENRQEATDNSPDDKKVAQEETAESLLDKFIIHYQKQLGSFPEEVKKAREQFQNIYPHKKKQDQPTESEKHSFAQSHEEPPKAPLEEEKKTNSLTLDKEEFLNSVTKPTEEKSIPAAPSSWNAVKAWSGKTVKKLTEQDLVKKVKKHWKTAAAVTIAASMIAITCWNSTTSQHSPLPINSPAKQPPKDILEDSNFVYESTKNFAFNASEYLQQLMSGTNIQNPTSYNDIFLDKPSAPKQGLASYLPALLTTSIAVSIAAVARFAHTRKKDYGSHTRKKDYEIEVFSSFERLISYEISLEVKNILLEFNKCNNNEFLDRYLELALKENSSELNKHYYEMLFLVSNEFKEVEGGGSILKEFHLDVMTSLNKKAFSEIKTLEENVELEIPLELKLAFLHYSASDFSAEPGGFFKQYLKYTSTKKFLNDLYDHHYPQLEKHLNSLIHDKMVVNDLLNQFKTFHDSALKAISNRLHSEIEKLEQSLIQKLDATVQIPQELKTAFLRTEREWIWKNYLGVANKEILQDLTTCYTEIRNFQLPENFIDNSDLMMMFDEFHDQLAQSILEKQRLRQIQKTQKDPSSLPQQPKDILTISQFLELEKTENIIENVQPYDQLQKNDLSHIDQEQANPPENLTDILYLNKDQSGNIISSFYISKKLFEESNYFKTCVSDNWSNTQKKKELDCPEVSFKAMALINQFFLNRTSLEINGDNVLELLFAADFLQIDSIKTEALLFLKNNIDINAIDIVLSIIPFASGKHSSFRKGFDHIISEWINACYFKDGIEGLERCFEEFNNQGIKIFSYKSPKNFDMELFSELVRQFPNLNSLSLSSSNITDEIGPYIESLSHLKSLNLHGCNKLTDAIGPYIENLSHLKSLNLHGCNKLTDRIGSDLENLTNLKSLNLNNCLKLTDGIGPHLAHLTNLTSLDLSLCKNLTDGIGPHLAHLTNLTSLDLSLCKNLTDGIGPHLAKLTNLKELYLEDCQELTRNVGPHLEKLINLEKLYLSHCKNLTDEIGPYLKCLIKLKYLNLSDTSLTNVIGHDIEDLTNLESLNLSNSLCTGEIISYLVNLANLKILILQNLNLHHNISPYLEYLISLEVLMLDKCTGVTTEIIPPLKKLTKLKMLNLTSCRLSNEDEFDTLRENSVKVSL